MINRNCLLLLVLLMTSVFPAAVAGDLTVYEGKVLLNGTRQNVFLAYQVTKNAVDPSGINKNIVGQIQIGYDSYALRALAYDTLFIAYSEKKPLKIVSIQFDREMLEFIRQDPVDWAQTVEKQGLLNASEFRCLGIHNVYIQISDKNRKRIMANCAELVFYKK